MIRIQENVSSGFINIVLFYFSFFIKNQRLFFIFIRHPSAGVRWVIQIWNTQLLLIFVTFS